MSRGLQITKGTSEVILNISTVKLIGTDSASWAATDINRLSPSQIVSITNAVEAYQPGDGGGTYAEGYEAGEAAMESAIASSQAVTAGLYKSKLASEDADIAAADSTDIDGQGTIFSESYSYLKTSAEMQDVYDDGYSDGETDGEATGYTNGQNAAASSQAAVAGQYKSKLSSENATIAAADATTLAGQGTIFSEAYQYLNTETDWHCDDPLCFELAEGVPSRTITIDTTSLKGGEISFNKSTWTSIIDNTVHEYTISTSNPILYVRCKMCVHQTYNDSERSAIFPSSDISGIILSGDLRSLCEANKGEMISDFELDRLFEYNTAIVDASRLKCHNNLIRSCYRNMFNGCTSLTAAPPLPATTLVDSCYYGMFSGCTSLASAPVLPATTLAVYCYTRMFYECTSLTSAPALQATVLSSNCYDSMFNGCTSLTAAPSLPATTLANYCYQYMFSRCASLTSAPALQATVLSSNCYASMFMGCTSLAAAPSLPATTMTSSCYSGMFRECTSLTTAPALPATTLAQSCYSNMFMGCTSLASAPNLPATPLANFCYQSMFSGCTSLAAAPSLPATTMTSSCYSGMFQNCTSLTTAPELPATTLADYCYQNMFYGCTSLTAAPELPATLLANRCYNNMFYNCVSLTSIIVGATSWNTNNTLNWVTNVPSTGTFTKPSGTSIPTGTSGIPSGWNVIDV